MKYTYLLIDLGAFIVPFLCSFHPRLRFYKQWRSFWPANIITALLFIAGDMLFTQWGVWGFNPRYISGIHMGNLPLEEVLFFVCIPYSCLFSYNCLKTILSDKQSLRLARLLTPILISELLITGIYFYDRLYTSTTFLASAIILAAAWYRRKPMWMGRFYLSYTIMLLPFFIVNGLLTGTGLDEPVVWYNNSENMGFRMMTIPFEDVFYGMLLVLLNTMLYEHFLRRSARIKTGYAREELLEA
jgi:lycopene cyclase domain-containing protein